MASSSAYFLHLTIFVILLSITGIASRPCKTFLISSYSLSITPENPNLDSDFTPTRFFTVFTIRRLNPQGFLPQTQIDDRRPQLSFPYINSLKDRTRDILSVVIGLLFGVGCGALTAATMYLVWALVVNRNSYNFDEEEDDFENDESDLASLKKLGYVKIPAPIKETA